MSSKKPSIIYLDDEEINLILFKEMFKADFDIYTTTSPTEALEFLRENEVNFVLTDQLMPTMTGVEFLKELDELSVKYSPKRVMISGFTQEGEVNEALKNNLIHKFVSKPWTYQGLKDLLMES